MTAVANVHNVCCHSDSQMMLDQEINRLQQY